MGCQSRIILNRWLLLKNNLYYYYHYCFSIGSTIDEVNHPGELCLNLALYAKLIWSMVGLGLTLNFAIWFLSVHRSLPTLLTHFFFFFSFFSLVGKIWSKSFENHPWVHVLWWPWVVRLALAGRGRFKAYQSCVGGLQLLKRCFDSRI